MARRFGIEAALGTDVAGTWALWQGMARVIAQGARLSAVRLAQTPAACEVLPLSRGFDENALYDNRAWVADHQRTSERRLFTTRRGDRQPTLCLSDVTSSSLEGPCHALAAFGDKRAGTAGKKHVVLGLWCAEEGIPVSVDVWAGHTPAMTTWAAPSLQGARRFGGERVTCVGDRGLSKSPQLEALAQAGFHDLTALTTPPVERLLQDKVLALALLTAQGCEGEHQASRSLGRRTPRRAEEVAAVRRDQPRRMEPWVAKQNASRAAPPRAQGAVALREGHPTLSRLQIDGGLTGASEGRPLGLRGHAEAQREAAKLDGCDVLKTARPQAGAGPEVVHER